MSSYSVDNENRNAESAHRTREEYKKREADLKKKQTEEINKLNQTHASKLRELQSGHGEQLDSVREKNQESLTEQDKKYQKEIEKIREAHKNQSKQSAQQTDSMLDMVNEQREVELDKAEKNYKMKEMSLSKNYENDRIKKDENFAAAAEYMRNAQEEGLNSERERLESRYRKDSNILRDAQDGKVADLSMELQNTRDSKNAEIRSLKQRVISDREKVEADKLGLLQQERKNSNVHADLMRDQYSKNLDSLREKYQRYNLESKSGRSSELENMKVIGDRRLNEAVGKRERELRETRAENDINTFLVRKEARDEKVNYMQNTKEQLDQAEAQRAEIYGSVNQKTAQEIKQMAKKSDDTIDRQNKHYQGRLQEVEGKYNESIENQVRALEIETTHDKKTNELNKQKLAFNLTREKNDLESYYQDMITEKDGLHKQELTDQRIKLTNDKSAALKVLEDKVRDSDMKNTEKQNILMQKYEKEIADLKDMHKAEKKRVVHSYEKRIDEMQRDFKVQLDSDRLASESREKSLRDQYGRQVNSMEARHTEEKIKMATKVKA